MRILFHFAAFAAFAFFARNASAQFVARVHLDLIATNTVSAQAALRGLETSIRARAAGKDLDARENKSRAAEVRTNEHGRVTLHADYVFTEKGASESFRAWLKSARAPGVTGTVRFHFCPLDGALKDWGGCDGDARAQFVEERFEDPPPGLR